MCLPPVLPPIAPPALRCFKNGVRTAPFVYLNRYRLHIAKDLLTDTMRPVTDIAETVGFESISYFDRMFKRAFGMTPKEMRRKKTNLRQIQSTHNSI